MTGPMAADTGKPYGDGRTEAEERADDSRMIREGIRAAFPSSAELEAAEAALHDDRDVYVDEALTALGGEDTEFYLTAQDAGASGAFGCATVVLSCRYQGCDWGLFVGEMELWEFVTDARGHWESTHATSAQITTGTPAR